MANCTLQKSGAFFRVRLLRASVARSSRHVTCSTIVDAGREWIEAQAAEWPKLAAALADDKLMKAARRTTKYWNRAWEQRVTELRASPALRHQMTRSHVHRTAIGVTRAMIANVRGLRGSATCPRSALTDAAARIPHRMRRSIRSWASRLMACSAGRCS